MARFVGDQSSVIFIYESGTYATVSGTGQWIGLVTNHAANEEENVQSIRYAGTGDRNVDLHVTGAYDITGAITYYPQDWKFLALSIGSCVDAGSPSPYTHVISETNSNNGNAFTSGTLNPFFSFTVEDTQDQGTAG